MELQEPEGKQRDSILDSEARINAWEGSVRSGKTIASIIRFLAFVADAPPGALLAIGRTERTLKRNILDVIAELLPNRDDYRIVVGSGECFIYGRKVYLVGAHDQRSEGKIRGLTLAGAYGDEVTLWPESFFTMLLSRLSVPGAKLFFTTNPDSPAHWLKKKYLDRENELDLARFHFTLDDNPSLDPAYLAALKKEYVGLWRRRFILGEWCIADGSVYDMFDPARHVVTDLPAFLEHRAGIDYGTSAPTVFLMLSRGVAGVWYAHHEYRWDSRKTGRQKTDAEYSADFRQWREDLVVFPQRVLIDPSAASFRLQLQRDGVANVKLADNDVLDGIRDVASMLTSGRLKLHGPTTQGLQAELAGYVWDDEAQKRGEDKPVKENDHSCDTLRYICHDIAQRASRQLLTA